MLVTPGTGGSQEADHHGITTSSLPMLRKQECFETYTSSTSKEHFVASKREGADRYSLKCCGGIFSSTNTSISPRSSKITTQSHLPIRRRSSWVMRLSSPSIGHHF